MVQRRMSARRFSVKSRRMSVLWKVVFALAITMAVVFVYMMVKCAINCPIDSAKIHSLPIGISFIA